MKKEPSSCVDDSLSCEDSYPETGDGFVLSAELDPPLINDGFDYFYFCPSQDSTWLSCAALSVPIMLFMSIVYGHFFALLCKYHEVSQLVKVINAGLSIQFFIITGVLFSYFYFRNPGSCWYRDLFFRKLRVIYFIEGIGLGILMFLPLLIIGAVSYFFVEFIKKLFGPEFSKILDAYPNVQEYLLKMDWNAFFIFAGIAVLVAPLVEEIVFRRIIFSYFNKTFNIYAAVIITSIFFASIHMSLVGFATLFILGVIFQILVIYHKSIYPAVFYHAVHNFLAMTLLFLIKYFELPVTI